MIVKFLGVIDIVGAFCFLFSSMLPSWLIMNVAMLLIAKGIVFSYMGNKMSIVDVVVAVVLVLGNYGIHSTVIDWICIIYLAQKGVLSLL